MHYWPSWYEGVTTHFFEIGQRPGFFERSGNPTPEFGAWLKENGFEDAFNLYSYPGPPTIATTDERAAFAFRMRFC